MELETKQQRNKKKGNTKSNWKWFTDFVLLLLIVDYYYYWQNFVLVFFSLRNFCVRFTDLIDCGGSRTKIINKVFLRWFVLWFYVRFRIESFSFLSFFQFLLFSSDEIFLDFVFHRSDWFASNKSKSIRISRLNEILMYAFWICVFRLSISLKVFFAYFQFLIFLICSIAWYLLYKYLIWKRWKFVLIPRKKNSQMRTTLSRKNNKTTTKMATRKRRIKWNKNGSTNI